MKCDPITVDYLTNNRFISSILRYLYSINIPFGLHYEAQIEIGNWEKIKNKNQMEIELIILWAFGKLKCIIIVYCVA